MTDSLISSSFAKTFAGFTAINKTSAFWLASELAEGDASRAKLLIPNLSESALALWVVAVEAVMESAAVPAAIKPLKMAPPIEPAPITAILLFSILQA